MSRREITLRVKQCPHCGSSHSYVIEVTLRTNPATRGAVARTQVLVACGVDGRSFRAQVDVPIGATQEFVAAQFARFAVAG
jgi:hypothetical protein